MIFWMLDNVQQRTHFEIHLFEHMRNQQNKFQIIIVTTTTTIKNIITTNFLNFWAVGMIRLSSTLHQNIISVILG